MISATGRNNTRQRHQRGTTLLEIMIVMAVIIMVTAALAVVVYDDPFEKQFIAAADEVEAIITVAKDYSVAQRRDAIALVDRGAIRAIPLNSASPLGALTLAEGFEFRILDIEDSRWKAPENFAITFFGSGLNTPTQMQIIHPRGVCEMELNPLTGDIERTIAYE